MAAKDKFEVGQGVVYRPYPGAPGEDGEVTGFSQNPNLVFVRYRGDQHSKATPVDALESLSRSRS